jgi:hypothetical protein
LHGGGLGGHLGVIKLWPWQKKDITGPNWRETSEAMSNDVLHAKQPKGNQRILVCTCHCPF